MKTYAAEELRLVVALHRKYRRGEPDGVRADLSSSDLSYSYLSYSDLRYSDLSYSYLSSSDLSYSNLSYSDLSYSDLSSSNLRYSDLSYSNLSSSNLRYSDLRYSNFTGALMPAGYTWEVYLSDVVPALLTAGGRSLAEVAAYWGCHSRQNCPIAVAFGVTDIEDVPALYRSEAEQFVQLYDARLIPKPLAT